MMKNDMLADKDFNLRNSLNKQTFLYLNILKSDRTHRKEGAALHGWVGGQGAGDIAISSYSFSLISVLI